jgi:FMN-dependent NADH-azoreductase
MESIMTKLLYIQASPRGAESTSIRLADAYLAALCAQHADLETDVIQLWQEDLPQFDGDRVAAKMAVMGGQLADTQKSTWDQIVHIANRFISADRYLFAVPMWNGGIPYRLKQYIDIIHQPGLLWGLEPQTGYFGLLKDKHAVVVLTSGAYAQGIPTPAFGTDHHSTYIHDWLEQAGVTAIDELRFQPTMLTADPAGAAEDARRRAVELAKSHRSL